MGVGYILAEMHSFPRNEKAEKRCYKI